MIILDICHPALQEKIKRRSVLALRAGGFRAVEVKINIDNNSLLKGGF